MDTLIRELSGSPPSGRLTVIVVYRLGGKRSDGKGVRDDLDGFSGYAVLAWGGLHSICFYRCDCNTKYSMGVICKVGVGFVDG